MAQFQSDPFIHVLLYYYKKLQGGGHKVWKKWALLSEAFLLLPKGPIYSCKKKSTNRLPRGSFNIFF